MSRPLLILIVVLVVVIGGMFVLGSRAHEKPLSHVEKVVPLANLQS